MNIVKSSKLNDVYLVEPDVFGDNRGYFFECFSEQKFDFLNGTKFVQHNESFSKELNVLRGLHFQQGEFSQAKLVRVIQGKILDVIVDLRPDSSSYGQWESFELSGDNKNLLFVPRGFAHGFLTLTTDVLFHYLCDNYYNKASESGIIWNDPTLNIPWPLSGEPILSDKDKLLPLFSK
jgi:dTDP-4-dehydrorhamnose 3,5-epimerase